ncbi:hypothetical protein HD554DRAFT_2094864 [Boletus coccyginus]|nr:hypothetical protein HD554DRAFT_2094864 [Boletus coccyginus]
MDPLISYPGIWAFSDSNHVVQVPTVAFTDTPRIRTFQTASSRNDRHKGWMKETDVVPYFMDLWSAEEIEDLAFIFGHDINHVRKLAKKWGPVPRALLKFYRKPTLETAYQRAVDKACERAAREPDAVILSGPLDLSTVFFLKPRGKDIIHRSDSFFFRLGEQLILEPDNTRADFFNIMSCSSQTRSAADRIFEEHVHCYILGKKSITINWYGKQPQVFNLPHLRVCTDLSDVTPTPPSYWRPKESNFAGIDGVIVTAECVLFIQVTIAQKHSSPQGMYCVWREAPALRSLKWKIVFIGSSEDRIKAVSAKYVDKLEVEKAEQKRGKEKPSKEHLPVGRVSILPGSLEFDLLRDDEPEESDT